MRPSRSCSGSSMIMLVRGTVGREELPGSPVFFMGASRRGRCGEAHSQDMERAVLTRL